VVSSVRSRSIKIIATGFGVLLAKTGELGIVEGNKLSLVDRCRDNSNSGESQDEG